MMSTINGSWVWHNGGAYFGVPVSNFLGWYLTVYVFFQLFSLYRSRRPAIARPADAARGAAPMFWWPPLVMYGATALRPVMTLLFDTAGPASVTDPAGSVWSAAALHGVCAMAGIFTMGAFSVLALLRLTERPGGYRAVAGGARG